MDGVGGGGERGVGGQVECSVVAGQHRVPISFKVTGHKAGLVAHSINQLCSNPSQAK